MLQALETLVHVALILIGFGLVIVVHELGHFLAARWAGIRVHAFAVGFGPAIVSYRKGMGFRRGSSEPAYLQSLQSERAGINPADPAAISPTEYRLNWVPLGGYVKMLGQEDANPAATSDASDSYQSKPVWKRMIVIAAGVVMNVILAGILFVIVFMAGLRVLSPAVGFVAPGSAAHAAGFLPGDVVLSVDRRTADNFSDIQIASAMAAKGRELAFSIARPGVTEPITLKATPVRDEESGLLQLGLGPASGTRVWGAGPRPPAEDDIRRALVQAGIPGIAPGSELVAVNGAPIEPATLPSGTRVPVLTPLLSALRDSEGRPVLATFRAPDGAERTVPVRPRVELQTATAAISAEATAPFAHLLGITPVSRVQTTTIDGDAAGLRPGDVLVRVGGVDWPSVPDTMAQVRQAAGQTIEVALLRPLDPALPDHAEHSPLAPAEPGHVRLASRHWTLVQLRPTVSREGRIGFIPEEASDLPIVTRAPRLARDPRTGDIPPDLPADRLFPRIMPGMLLTAAAGQPVADFASARAAILAALAHTPGFTPTTAPAAATERPTSASTNPDTQPDSEPDAEAGAPTTELEIAFALLDPSTLAPLGTETRTLELTQADAASLAALGWLPGPIDAAFQPSQIVMQASGPLHALAMGTRETLRKVTLAYLTIQRLFEGTVQVRHLKGPVGITHIGSQFAAEGPLYLLFFLALISANLAVINFLPMPIVDGGMFLLLCYEGLRGKPAPMPIQNALNLIGLALIGTLFLTVTFYDIRGLFGL